ncbi:hypothetical protein [Streptomyces sp. NRRL S-350]|uniref:hypothetical protein n=1 Tax=Streptomyces sp. NRRL S-350 TaxID=1463902 RepID=UPI0004C10688|nr:hypothetical protein [Streptomyces sp. NRRL S-350]
MTESTPGRRRKTPAQKVTNGLEEILGDSLQRLHDANPGIGFTLIADTKPKKHAPATTHGGSWAGIDKELLRNIHLFEFSNKERAVLDNMTADVDKDGVWKGTQAQLAATLRCNQTTVSRAIVKLDRKNFVWKVARGTYQVNPTWAFGWGSDHSARVIAKIGKTVMATKVIKIPGKKAA